MREIILISVSGTDKPGLTNKLTKVLSEYKINILDVGQAVIHATLSLGILIEIPPESESSPVLRDILFKAHELELNVKFKPIDVQEYEDWVRAQGKPRYIITILGQAVLRPCTCMKSVEIISQE